MAPTQVQPGDSMPSTKVSVAELKGRRLGRVLTKMGKVTREQVHEALKIQQSEDVKRPVGEILVELGHVTELNVREAIAGQAGLELISLKDREIPDETIKAIPSATANAYQLVPVKFDPSTRSIAVAVKSADNFAAIDDLRNLLGFKKVRAVLAPEDEIDEILKDRYGGEGPAFSEIYAEAGSSAAVNALDGRGDSLDIDTLNEAAGDNAIVNFVSHVLNLAIRDKASDIHFEPFEDEFKLRYRIDGVLYDMQPPPKNLAMAIVSRLKSHGEARYRRASSPSGWPYRVEQPGHSGGPSCVGTSHHVRRVGCHACP